MDVPEQSQAKNSYLRSFFDSPPDQQLNELEHPTSISNFQRVQSLSIPHDFPQKPSWRLLRNSISA